MLVSYNWLQTYIKEKLPSPEKLADSITMGIFEVESIEKKTKTADTLDSATEDIVLDIKVLPDRNHYCLSHRYIAQEISALLGSEYIVPEIQEFPVEHTEYAFSVSIDNTTEDILADRYVTRVIEQVTVAESPDWLKNKLAVLGQRSINTIVDLTNYIMFETGQPLHVFDADKVKGNITIRRARDGETVTTLDGKVIQLDSSIVVIADDEGPLDIAGIKGGKKAELTSDTTRIMTSAACFNPVLIRKAAQKTGVRTDASKRFENALTPERAGLAESMLTSYIKKLDAQVSVGEVIDIYPNPRGETVVQAYKKDIENRLGVAIADADIVRILNSIDMKVNSEKDESGEIVYTIAVPPYRRDVLITEDVADEVGRIYGYDKIEGVVPSAEGERTINTHFYYHEVIKKALADIGFSEVYTYSLTDEGTMAVQNPLTSERSKMRESISYMLSKKFLMNMKNVDLLGLKEIRMFEIGKVFSLDYGNQDTSSSQGFCEKTTIAFGVARTKVPKGHDPKTELTAIASYLIETIGASSVPEIRFTELKGDAQTPCVGFVAEFDLDGIVSSQAEPKQDADMGSYCDSAKLTEQHNDDSAEAQDSLVKRSKRNVFVPISEYPFAVRDIAVFVPGERHAEQDVLKVILHSLTEEQKKILVRTTLFDVFTKQKEGEPVKTSYAYRLVFQSYERTLTEEEIQSIMKHVTDALSIQIGWEVR